MTSFTAEPARRRIAARWSRRGQRGSALMIGLMVWVGITGVSMLALLNMTMTSSRIAAIQTETAAQFRAVDAALETAVTQVSRDPDARIGASTGRGDGSCVEPLAPGGAGDLQYRDDDLLVSVTARCTGTAEHGRKRQKVRTVVLDAVLTLPDGERRAAGTARIQVSDVRGNGAAVVVEDWAVTPERPYVPPTTTTTTTTTTTVKPTTTTVKPTTTTTTTTTTTSTTTTTPTTTTTQPGSPSPATWTMRISSDWTTGYCAEVTVRNPTASTLTWVVDTPVEGQLYEFWNGTYTRSGDTLRVRGADWNRSIKAGATTSFGFCSNR